MFLNKSKTVKHSGIQLKWNSYSFLFLHWKEMNILHLVILKSNILDFKYKQREIYI